MHKIILDTNVIISALISKSYPYKILYKIVFTKKALLFLSENILSEYYDVLKRPTFSKYKDFIIQSDLVLNTLNKIGIIFHPNIKIDLLSDKTDNKFIELGIFSKADYLITGNINDFTMSEYQNLKIVSPKQYFQIFTEAFKDT